MAMWGPVVELIRDDPTDGCNRTCDRQTL